MLASSATKTIGGVGLIKSKDSVCNRLFSASTFVHKCRRKCFIVKKVLYKIKGEKND